MGRTPTNGARMRVIAARLTEQHIEAAKRLGDGSFTAGLRRLLDALPAGEPHAPDEQDGGSERPHEAVQTPDSPGQGVPVVHGGEGVGDSEA